MKAFTTFAIGVDAASGRTMQPLPDGIRSVTSLDIPEGANPSKIGTWIQRRVIDGAVPPECPEELVDTVELGAAGLLADPTVALGIDMTGNPAGDKMREKLGAEDGEKAWLVFGAVPIDPD
jgi:hypothetical protein